MNTFRRYVFLMISLLSIILLAGCFEQRGGEQWVVAEIHRSNSGPYVAGTWESMVMSFPGSLDNYTLTWRVAVSPASSSAPVWEYCDSVVSVASGLSYTFIVPDSTNVPFKILVTCVAKNYSSMYNTGTEGTISGYQPTSHPFYLGTNSTCNSCHSATVTAWNQTAHSHRLPITATNSLSSCNQCHGTGYNTTVANGGSDEIFTGQMDGIQCEACHGPSEAYGLSGSGHIAVHGFVSGSRVTSQLCLTCHTSTTAISNHTWLSNNIFAHTHKFTTIRSAIESSSDPDRCAGCHLESEAIKRLDGDSVSHWSNAVPADSGIGCAVCHSAHPRSSGSYKMLRVTPDRICQTCHQSGVDGTPSVNNLPLHPQADMLTNNLSAIIPLNGVTLPLTSEHSGIQGSCAVCHLYATPWQAGATPTGDHNFRVDYTACATCHVGIDSRFIITSQDSIPEHLYQLSIVVQQLQAQGDTVTAHHEAFWIESFLRHDGSGGIHNKQLTRALLSAAYSRLGISR